MKKIIENLYVGSDFDCRSAMAGNYAVVHACKHPCHRRGVGYKGNLNSSHSYYLIKRSGCNLYLNMVDMEKKLLGRYTNPIMKAALQFIEKYISDKKVLVHCNRGLSRSPSIILLYLASKKIITDDSYQKAKSEFIRKYYGKYMPNRGIRLYLNSNWNELIKKYSI